MLAGIASGIQLIGAASRVLARLSDEVQNKPPESPGVSKDDFLSIIKEAVQELKEESSDTSTDDKEDTSSNSDIKIEKLFSYLDANEDGILNKDEFERLKVLMQYARFKIR